MALTEKNRSTIYRGLRSLISDEEAIDEMLSYFPARDVEEPVTKEFLRAENTVVRMEVGELKAELHAEMSELRGELRAEMAGLKTELRAEMSGLKTELRADMAELKGELRAEMSGLKGELRAEMAELKDDLRAEMSGLKGELRAEMAELKDDLRAEMAELKGEISDHRNETHLGFADARTDVERMVRTVQTWTVGAVVSVAGVVLAAAGFTG